MILAALLLTCTPIAIDGDTISLCRERIRLVDVDSPELRSRCPSERRLAIQARNRLSQLLREPFRLVRSGRARDRYGRRLAVVVRVRDERSVGDILVAERLARTWSGRRMPWC